ncbi:DNA adenine methylase [Schinkia azotoformans]|uniref:DNA adenine methylase n=1 Tax=Schinkia azotoformans TaxID=1454 RepID=UPI002DBD06DE|nr:hypothetical protein [Schinkia azotoformans]MEC1718738.1 hypothetical protein [Schinkia azotoformans]MEC1742765.1 hypothetical protein [Schinkia azotoformans]MEC1748113.1 hypothetical protein [Schinkia azotoformans]MEC1760552.1 hypothetical protein [Schinkia azotoformans]MEC1769289.1 hypothetical protein [Schinkia azotoformans]
MERKTKDETMKVSMRVPKSKLELLMSEYGTSSITEVFNRLVEEKLEHRFQADATRSVITAIGGKNRVAKKMIELMPEHNIYIEPFGNTASVLLRKPKVSTEVYNDIDGNVTNFFQVLQDNPIGLYNACSSLPYSEEMYRKSLEAGVPDNPLEKAVRFFYLSRVGFLGANSRGFKSSTPDRNNSALYHKECERFYAVSKRFQGVEITNKDFKKIIKKYGNEQDAFIMADPPYYDGTDYYNADFKLADHSQLAKMLAGIKGKAMVCHSKNYQIHKLYTGLGFRFEVIRTKYMSRVAVNEAGKKSRPETSLYLYMNY